MAKFKVTDFIADSPKGTDTIGLAQKLHKVLSDFGLTAYLPRLPAFIRYYHFSQTTIPDPDFATPSAGTLTVISGDYVYTWWLDQENLNNPIFVGNARFKS